MSLRSVIVAVRLWWSLPPLRERVLDVLARAEREGQPWLSGLVIERRARYVFGSIYTTLGRLEGEGLVISQRAPELDVVCADRVLHRRVYRLAPHPPGGRRRRVEPLITGCHPDPVAA